MPDHDLSGDDLKYVRYSIVFTKRDYEATLQQERSELVDYATDGGSYGGLKIAEFSARPFPRPGEWGNKYPPEAGSTNPLTMTDIPREDQKYIKFIYQVDQRLPKGDADYEKRQAEALEAISRKIG